MRPDWSIERFSCCFAQSSMACSTSIPISCHVLRPWPTPGRSMASQWTIRPNKDATEMVRHSATTIDLDPDGPTIPLAPFRYCGTMNEPVSVCQLLHLPCIRVAIEHEANTNYLVVADPTISRRQLSHSSWCHRLDRVGKRWRNTIAHRIG